MPLLSWSENYGTKIKQFDDQHKRLFDLVNQLHEAMKEGRGKEIIGDVLKALGDYTKTHFAAEEALMKTNQYPFYEEHKKEHNLLLVQVKHLQQQYQEGRAPVTPEVMNFLRNWIDDHIQASDKKYGPFFNGKGIV